LKEKKRKLKMPTAFNDTPHMFIQDDEGHWYIIPVSQKEQFRKWLEFYGESADYDGPEFHQCRCRHPSSYMFTELKENG